MQTGQKPVNEDTCPTNYTVSGTSANKTTEARRCAFLDVYRRTGRVKRSCRAVGIAFKTHYRWLARDPAYRLAFEQVVQLRLAEHAEAVLQELELRRRERAQKLESARAKKKLDGAFAGWDAADAVTQVLPAGPAPAPVRRVLLPVEDDLFGQFFGGSWMG